MQLSTVFAVVLSLAGANAAAAGKLRRQEDPIGTITAFANDGCDAEPADTFEVERLGDCFPLTEPAESAMLTPAEETEKSLHFLAGFSGKNCSGIAVVSPPSRCGINLNGDGTISSVMAIKAPPLPEDPKPEDPEED